MSDRWVLGEPQDVAWRHWDGEAVAHHHLSNDTHRLAEPAGWILDSLEVRGALTLEELDSAGPYVACDLAPALETLASLGFVSRC